MTLHLNVTMRNTVPLNDFWDVYPTKDSVKNEIKNEKFSCVLLLSKSLIVCKQKMVSLLGSYFFLSKT